MSNIDKKLSMIFDIEPLPESSNIVQAKEVAITEEKSREIEYVKRTMVQMMEKGKTAIEELHAVARDSEKSRDFEVLFSGIKTVTEIGEKLIQSDAAQKEKQNPQQVTNNQTAVFVGSTAELSKLFKKETS